jgi:hypothetical protein
MVSEDVKTFFLIYIIYLVLVNKINIMKFHIIVHSHALLVFPISCYLVGFYLTEAARTLLLITDSPYFSFGKSSYKGLVYLPKSYAVYCSVFL